MGRVKAKMATPVKTSNGPPTIDYWDREFRYTMPGVHNAGSYDLWSLGADGESGTADDIKNW